MELEKILANDKITVLLCLPSIISTVRNNKNEL